MKTVLHVGCGPLNITSLPAFFQDGEWEELRLDIDPSVNPDIVASLQDLSIIEDGSVDAVYSSHNIEHVWGFEVPVVLAEFHRVLSEDGLAAVLCPDLLSVANAMAAGDLYSPLYQSAAGPISALDVLYGHGAALASGRHYMAHKTGFTSQSLAGALRLANFRRVFVARDNCFGLHAVAFKSDENRSAAERIAPQLMPAKDYLIAANQFAREFDNE